jgi:hypothetical protein
MLQKYDGFQFTLRQIVQKLIGGKAHKKLLSELSGIISGKSVLLCGAGQSLKDIDSYISDYDLVFGLNGLFRLKGGCQSFDYFFIEDRAAYNNYVHDKSNVERLITVAGMPGNKSRQLNFLHQYGFPSFLGNPKISTTGSSFFWGGSVAFFALNVLLVCRASKIGVLGVDLIDTNAYALDGYHVSTDSVMPPNFQLSRYCLRHLSLEARVSFPCTVIEDLGYGEIFKWNIKNE